MRALVSSLLAAGLLLPGCSDSEPVAEQEQDLDTAVQESSPAEADAPPVSHREVEVLYRCTDGVEFTVTFGDQSAMLTRNDRQHELRQQPAPSGRRYAGDEYELIDRDSQATLITADATRDCSRLEDDPVMIPGGDETGIGVPPAA